jgi:hypothetical protein
MAPSPEVEAPAKFTLSDTVSLLAILSFFSTILWFILKPVITMLHRFFGDQAYKVELERGRKTSEAVEQLQTKDIPELKALAQTAVEGVERIEETVQRLSQNVLELAAEVGRHHRVGEFRPPVHIRRQEDTE